MPSLDEAIIAEDRAASEYLLQPHELAVLDSTSDEDEADAATVVAREPSALDVAYYVRVIDAAIPRFDRVELGDDLSLTALLAARERVLR